MAVSTARSVLRQDVADILFASRLFRRGTITTGGTTGIIDSALRSATVRPTGLIDCWLLVTSGAQAGSAVRVSEWDRALGTLFLNPPLPGNAAAGDTYELFYGLTGDEENKQPVSAADIESAINRVLRGTDTLHLWAPSLVTDSDMDANLLTNWPAVGTPTTREFVTTAANVRIGARSLHLVSDALTEGAASLTANVHENDSLLVSVHLSVVSGSVQVILYDESAAANVRASGSVDDPAWTEVRFIDSVADDMEQMRLRFLSATAASEWYVSPHVIVQSDRERLYPAPSWLISEDQIVGAVRQPQPPSAEATDSYVSFGKGFRSLLGLETIRSDRDLTPFYLKFAAPLSHGPVYLLCQRPFAEITTDTATTVCDRHWLTNKALSLLYSDRGDDAEAKKYARRAKAARPSGYGGRTIRSELSETMV